MRIFSLNSVEPDFQSSDLNNDTDYAAIQADSEVLTNITKAPQPDTSPIDDFPEDLFTGILHLERFTSTSSSFSNVPIV